MPSVVRTYEEREEWLMAVLRCPELTQGDKVCAAALMSHLNIKTGQLNPSNSRLARITDQAERSVFGELRRLKHAGFIHWAKAGGRRTHAYALLLRDADVRNDDSGQTANAGTGDRNDHSGNDRNDGSGRTADPPTPDRNGGEPCPESPSTVSGMAIPANLENLKNLDCDFFSELRQAIGEARWRDHLFKGAKYQPPATIIFISKQQREFALQHYQKDFEARGYVLTERNAA